jgi:hypothetical protein
MKPHKHARGESTGYMIEEHGHQEWVTEYAPDKRVFDRTEHTPVVERRRRVDGWTADRQTKFLQALAETGSVTQAAEFAYISPRSAYRLRAHPAGKAFARAWDAALAMAAQKLTALAYDRAVYGGLRQVWRDGELVAQSRVPSDQMLMFLLRSLAPHQFGEVNAAERAATLARVQADWAPAMDAITDVAVSADLLDTNDYRPRQPLPEEKPTLRP